jgi:signal transduction histidine kinase/ligand-binding sensor domain-containing protein
MRWALGALLGLGLGFPASAAAEALPSLAQEYSITVFDQEAGLWQFALASVAQTPDGWLWFSSFGSLGRFNGTRFEDVRVDSVVAGRTWTRKLFTDRRGRLWVGAEGRILCRETNVWRCFGAAEGLPNMLFGSLTEDAQGTLWAASSSTIVRQAGARFEMVPGPQGQQERGFRLVVDRGGSVWCSSDVSLHRFDAGRWVTVLSETETRTNRLLGLQAARSGGVWAGSEHEVKLWQAGRWAKVWPRPAGFRRDALQLLDDSRGNLWAAGWQNGLIVYGPDGQVRQATTREGLLNNSLTDVLEDSEGNIWLTSNGGGLVRLRPLAFRSYGIESGLEQVPNCVIEDAPGRMLIGTHGAGLVGWETGRLSQHEAWAQTNRPGSMEIRAALKDRKGDLWVGCRDVGLSRLSPGGWEGIPPAQIGAGTIQSLFEDREGRLWVGTVAGLAVRDGGKFKVVKAESGLPHMIVHAISQDSAGHIWVCGSGYGLFREEAGRFTRFRVPGLIDNASFRSLLAGRDGSLWVGTAQRALCRIQGTNCFVYGEAQGLPRFSIYGILEDDSGYLWLGGSPGAMRIRLNSLDRVLRDSQARLEYQMFDRQDGFPSPLRYGFQPVCCKASDGRLWFAAVRGLAVVDPTLVLPQPPPPPVVIESLVVDNKRQTGWAEAGKQLRLPATSRHVDIRYSVVRLGRPEQIRFQHRLHPEGAWENAGQNRTASFHDLRPSQYQFEVRAADNDEVWGPATALAFEVQPYYWHTAWFRLAVLLVIGSLAWSAYRWRVIGLEKRRQAQADFSRRLIESQENERKRIAAGLHDSLGQNLLVIKNRALLGLQETAATPDAREQFGEISRMASHALDEVRAISHNLRPYQIDRLGLTKALEAMAAGVSRASGLPCVRHFDPLDGLLAPPLEIHLYRVVQELLNNVVKHSDASECRLEVAQLHRRLVLTVKDDGRGFDYAATAGRVSAEQGMGLDDIAERVRILGGTAQCEARPGQGTHWRIEIPVKLAPDNAPST